MRQWQTLETLKQTVEQGIGLHAGGGELAMGTGDRPLPILQLKQSTSDRSIDEAIALEVGLIRIEAIASAVPSSLPHWT